MIGNTQTIRFHALILVFLVLFGGGITQAAPLVRVYPKIIEVFISNELPAIGEAAMGRGYNHSEFVFHIYNLVAIQHSEKNLSKNLPTNPQRSKNIVLQRIQQLDEQSSAQMQHTAIGLVKAMKYGIDRYPAIVFNGEAVVFGITDLKVAIDHYQTWKTRVSQ